MQEILQNKTCESITYYRKHNILNGFNLTLLSLLLNAHTKVIKLEGRREEYGRKVVFHDIIAVKEGKLDYYVSYGKNNLMEYFKIDADVQFRHDALDVGLVVRCFVEQRGMYTDKGGE